MELIHGNTKQAIYRRIADRATALYEGRAKTDDDLRDPSDINSGEDAEIASARKLAEHWWKGEFLEPWHVHTIPSEEESR